MAVKSLIKIYKKHGRVIDHGWGRIQDELKIADGSFVKIGLPENGLVKLGNKSGIKKDTIVNMSELVVVGAVQEFGAPNKNIPERSWLRSTFDEQKPNISKVVERLHTRIMLGLETAESALNKLGIWYTAKVKRKITTLKEPPNAPATIRQKGSSNPLIDTGQMRNSIQHKVKLKRL